MAAEHELHPVAKWPMKAVETLHHMAGLQGLLGVKSSAQGEVHKLKTWCSICRSTPQGNLAKHSDSQRKSDYHEKSGCNRNWS